MTGSTAPAMPTLRQVLARAHMRLILFAVMMAGITLLITGVLAIRGYADRNLSLVAQTVAYTIEPALVFDDMDAARNGIAAVAASEGVRAVQVWDLQGRLLVEWHRPDDGKLAIIRRFGEMFSPSPALSSVRRGKDVVARIRVIGDAGGLGRYVFAGLLAALVSMLLTVLVTRMLAQRLQRDVTEPLARIAEVAHAVREDRQFDRRVPASDIQEVDQLGYDFNALLDELDIWHAGLLSENRMLEKLATRDALTGLGNRTMFERALAAAIKHADAEEASFAAVYIDVNRFKQVNDTHGHDAGDAMLIVIAARLRAALRSGDQAFRLGGDEFALIVAPGILREDIALLTDRVIAGMEQPITLPSGANIVASLSLGCALYPEDSADARDLLRHADAAMYAAKAGRTGTHDR